jgi:acetylornithine deacetylase
MKFNPGKIKGGDWTSSVASWCEVECRLGVLPGTPIAVARAQVVQAIAAAVDNDDLLKQNPPEIIWHGMQSEGSALLPGGAAEAELAKAHQAVLGVVMPEQISSGANDTRQYALYYGIPSLCYGPYGENIHAFDERADLQSVKRTTLILARFISAWCGVASR